jgi:chloride channel protein, CIC family
MYGVGYPVMDRVLANHYVLWFVVVLMLGKILAASLTLWIGGSGGVFAPSLFTGAAAGMAFGSPSTICSAPRSARPLSTGW